MEAEGKGGITAHGSNRAFRAGCPVRAAPTKTDTADVSKPGPGRAWEFKKEQKGGSSILRPADVQECTKQTRQLCELGTCHRLVTVEAADRSITQPEASSGKRCEHLIPVITFQRQGG